MGHGAERERFAQGQMLLQSSSRRARLSCLSLSWMTAMISAISGEDMSMTRSLGDAAPR